MKKKLAPLAENIAESGVACLLTMVQGNVLLLGVGHWMTASQTGLVSGTAATAAILLAKSDNRLIIAGILGAVTGVVDYFVHPGMIGEARATEAVITGLGAAALSYGIATLMVHARKRRRATPDDDTSH